MILDAFSRFLTPFMRFVTPSKMVFPWSCPVSLSSLLFSKSSRASRSQGVLVAWKVAFASWKWTGRCCSGVCRFCEVSFCHGSLPCTDCSDGENYWYSFSISVHCFSCSTEVGRIDVFLWSMKAYGSGVSRLALLSAGPAKNCVAGSQANYGLFLALDSWTNRSMNSGGTHIH